MIAAILVYLCFMFVYGGITFFLWWWERDFPENGTEGIREKAWWFSLTPVWPVGIFCAVRTVFAAFKEDMNEKGM